MKYRAKAVERTGGRAGGGENLLGCMIGINRHNPTLPAFDVEIISANRIPSPDGQRKNLVATIRSLCSARATFKPELGERLGDDRLKMGDLFGIDAGVDRLDLFFGAIDRRFGLGLVDLFVAQRHVARIQIISRVILANPLPMANGNTLPHSSWRSSPEVRALEVEASEC